MFVHIVPCLIPSGTRLLAPGGEKFHREAMVRVSKAAVARLGRKTRIH